MTNTVGRVNFTAVLDGKGTPRDAENIGRKAGAAAGEGYDKEWSKTFRDTLSESGKKSFDAWQKSGSKDGGVYGKEFTARLKKFQDQAAKTFTGIRLDPNFMDNFAKGFDDAGLAAGELQRQLRALEGSMNPAALNAAKRQVDDWAESQRLAAIETNNQRDALARLREETEAFKAAQAEADRQAVAAARTRAEQIKIEERQQKERQANLAKLVKQAERDYETRIEGSKKLTAQLNKMWESERRGQSESQKLERDLDALGGTVEKHSLHWKNLSHNQRQWTLIIGAVLASMEDLAVLGSAAGAGLVAVGGAATSAVAGIGGVAAVFVTLGKELDELPPDLREVASEFKNFTGVFGELRETIASGAFARMGGVFDSLQVSLRSLQPQLNSLGSSVGNVFNDFAESVEVGSEALDEIRRALDLAGPNFEELARISGTFGVAFLRAFNRAQPLVEDMFDWLGRLARQFDEFTQSTGFDEWMSNAQTTFDALGPLLDAVGRGLNDLVTPESVARTAEFIGSLTDFMPDLFTFLDILGRLDIFGIIAAGLEDLGRGLSPLAESFQMLAEQLSRLAVIALEQLGDALVGISMAIAPVVKGLAEFLAAVPDTAWRTLANSVLAVAGAFLVLRGSGALAGALIAIDGFSAAARTAETSVGRLGNSIKAGLGKAGLVGIGIAGVLALMEGVKTLATEISGVDRIARDLVANNASLTQSYRELNTVAGELPPTINDIDAVFEKIAGLNNPFDYIAAAFDETGRQAQALKATFAELDTPLAEMAATSVPQAVEAFNKLAAEYGLSAEQQKIMLDSMPQLQEAFLNAVGPTVAQGEALAVLSNTAKVAAVDIEAMADKIRDSAEEMFSARDASRDYEAAIDDLEQSIKDNGTSLDITTEAGRNNEAALDDMAQAALENAAAVLENTDNQKLANDAIATGRTKLIEMLGQFGITGQAAEDYANKLGLIPENIVTEVRADTANAQAGIDRFIRTNNGRTITIYTDGRMKTGDGREFFASGGVASTATAGVFGEAGPEALVPLDRPLSMVDPSVRWLSAIAQGKATPSFASGGVVGGGKSLTIDAGAIQVIGSLDPRRTALETVDRIIEVMS